MAIRSGLAVAAIMAMIALPTLSRAAEPIKDPRKYCDRLAELLADGDIDELTSEVVANSTRAVLEVEKKNAIAGFAALPLKAGALRSHEHAAEWKIGEAYVNHYYAFIFEYTPFFLKCTMYRPDENWILADFIGNGDPVQLGFTQ